MKAYFDTSAFSSIIFRDDGWQQIESWIEAEPIEGVISDFGWGEFVSAIGQRSRRGVITPQRAVVVLAQAPVDLRDWARHPIITHDIVDATAMLGDYTLTLRLPDAIHLAVARRLGIVLVSTDLQQVRAARMLGIGAINPLEAHEIRS